MGMLLRRHYTEVEKPKKVEPIVEVEKKVEQPKKVRKTSK